MCVSTISRIQSAIPPHSFSLDGQRGAAAFDEKGRGLGGAVERLEKMTVEVAVDVPHVIRDVRSCAVPSHSGRSQLPTMKIGSGAQGQSTCTLSMVFATTAAIFNAIFSETLFSIQFLAAHPQSLLTFFIPTS